MSAVRVVRCLGAATAALLSLAGGKAWSETRAHTPIVVERLVGATFVEGRAYAEGADDGNLRKVRDGVFMLGGAGANILVQIGPDGVLLVDSGRAESAPAVLAAIRSLTATPVTIIVNTSYRPDDTGANAAISAAARTAVSYFYGYGSSPVQNYAHIWAFETVLDRLSHSGKDGKPLAPPEAWPLDTYFVSEQDFFFNNEPVRLCHEPDAVTDGDTIVVLRRSDVIATGDIFNTAQYPVIQPGDGGGINGEIAALNHIVALAVPARNEEGGTIIVPGHGHVSDQYEVVLYRDAMTIIRDRIAAMIKRGMSLEQVEKARPTLDFDGDYGASTGPWTPEMFVEAIYNDLKRPPR